MVHSEDSDVGKITLLVERFAALTEKGIEISIAELCKDSPSLSQAVRREIEELRQMDKVLGNGLPSNAAKSSQTTQLTQGNRRQGSATTTASYSIERFVASGGFSEIYLAYDKQLDRKVALKFPRTELEASSVYIARLEREASITSKLSHPGIVAVYAQGNDDRGAPFYAMRFIEGAILTSRIREFHASGAELLSDPGRQLLMHFASVCRTIAYAHNRRIIHRDIKPDNIALGNFGESYVLDWGLAKFLSEPCSHDLDPQAENASNENLQLTLDGNVMGSPGFMSPEQARGEPASKASDIFGLGATLFCILTGKPPFGGKSLPEVLENARKGNTRISILVKPSIPRPIRSILNKAMHSDAHARYDNALEFAKEIERFLANEKVVAHQETILEKGNRWVQRNRKLSWGIAFSICLVSTILLLSNLLLSDANKRLTMQEAKADGLRIQAEQAFAEAQGSLYIQNIALVESEIRKNNIVRAQELLDRCPDEHRKLEWHLLQSIVRRHVPHSQLLPRESRCLDLHMSSDGKTLACCLDDGKVQVCKFNKLDDEQFHKPFAIECKMHAEIVRVSPDGSRLFVGGWKVGEGRPRGKMEIWDLASRQRLAYRYGHGFNVTSATWHDSGSCIATGGTSGTIRIRDPADLLPDVRIHDAHEGSVSSLAFAKSTTATTPETLFSGGEQGLMRVWKTAVEAGSETISDASCVQTIKAHNSEIASLECHDDLLVSAGHDRLVHIWDTENRLEKIRDLTGHTNTILRIATCPKSKYFASAGLDGVIRIWSYDSDESVQLIRHHTSHIRALVFSPDGEWLLSAGDDGGVFKWRTETIEKQTPLGSLVSFNAEFLLSHSNQNILTAWDPISNLPVTRKLFDSDLTTVAPLNNSTGFLCGHRNGKLEMHTIGQTETLISSDSKADSALFTPDDKSLFIGFRDGTVLRRDLDSDAVRSSENLRSRITGFCLDSTGTRLVVKVADSRTIHILNAETLERSSEFDVDSRGVFAIATHPTRPILATAGLAGVVRLWNLDQQVQLDEFRIGASWANCLCFSPDGSRLLVGSEDTLFLWDMERGQELLSMAISRCIHSMSFSKDGKFLAVGGEAPRVRFWRVAPENVHATHD